MARARTIAEDIPEVASAPREIQQPTQILCEECKHWHKPWPLANVGECGLSRRFLSSPIMTTDLGSCSKAER